MALESLAGYRQYKLGSKVLYSLSASHDGFLHDSGERIAFKAPFSKARHGEVNMEDSIFRSRSTRAPRLFPRSAFHFLLPTCLCLYLCVILPREAGYTGTVEIVFPMLQKKYFRRREGQEREEAESMDVLRVPDMVVLILPQQAFKSNPLCTPSFLSSYTFPTRLCTTHLSQHRDQFTVDAAPSVAIKTGL